MSTIHTASKPYRNIASDDDLFYASEESYSGGCIVGQQVTEFQVEPSLHQVGVSPSPSSMSDAVVSLPGEPRATRTLGLYEESAINYVSSQPFSGPYCPSTLPALTDGVTGRTRAREELSPRVVAFPV